MGRPTDRTRRTNLWSLAWWLLCFAKEAATIPAGLGAIRNRGSQHAMVANWPTAGLRNLWGEGKIVL